MQTQPSANTLPVIIYIADWRHSESNLPCSKETDYTDQVGALNSQFNAGRHGQRECSLNFVSRTFQILTEKPWERVECSLCEYVAKKESQVNCWFSLSRHQKYIENPVKI